MSVIVRTATEADLDEVMRVEESWPEGERAPREKFLARLNKFPDGFFAAEQNGVLRATMTSCPVTYGLDHLAQFHHWDQVTNYGLLYEIGAAENYNALYIVSGVIEEGFRAGGLLQRLVGAEVNLAQRLGFKYVTAGAVIPGYASYCRKHGTIDARKYAFLNRGQRLIDPFLELYRRMGFRVPDERHVLEEYYPDAASHNYAALVVRECEPSSGTVSGNHV